VTVFQNVSRESRHTRRAVTRAPLGDGMRPVARVGACFFGERANSESMKKSSEKLNTDSERKTQRGECVILSANINNIACYFCVLRSLYF